MTDTRSKPEWLMLPNPFPSVTDTSEVIISHVSARRADILEIITGYQSAIILAGAPNIGKSALIRHLQRSPEAAWSWRNELQDYRAELNLDDIHFVQINLVPLEGIEQKEILLSTFVEQCALALHRTYRRKQPSLPPTFDLKGLRELLRTIDRETPNARYFVMLDTIERLGVPGMPSFPLDTTAQTPQEHGIALLDHCGAVRTLVDLVDEFTFFGVIFSIESLPRPKIDDQFTHVSADLARFTTMILQIFARADASGLLAQEPEDFGASWASRFKSLGGRSIFSRAEQDWLLEQAGTHPYLLQQFCFHTFRLKQEHASRNGVWTELQESDRTQLIELINERLSTFLTSTWARLQSAVDKSRPGTKSSFDTFINVLAQNQDVDKEIDAATWKQLGSELRYILYSEGIVRYDRYDPLQTIHFPGVTLHHYLAHKAIQSSTQLSTAAVSPIASRELRIVRSANQEELLSLSELEYRLLKTLLQHPRRSTEEELIKSAWGKSIDRTAFTQRMYQLRRKLREACGGVEIIENRYGGFYSLNNPDWFHLE